MVNGSGTEHPGSFSVWMQRSCLSEAGTVNTGCAHGFCRPVKGNLLLLRIVFLQASPKLPLCTPFPALPSNNPGSAESEPRFESEPHFAALWLRWLDEVC